MEIHTPGNGLAAASMLREYLIEKLSAPMCRHASQLRYLIADTLTDIKKEEDADDPEYMNILQGQLNAYRASHRLIVSSPHASFRELKMIDQCLKLLDL